MKAIVKDQVGQALLYMQTLQGQRMKPLLHLAKLAAEDEDGELGRLVTEMAMECLNADHNVVILGLQHVPAFICKACADEMMQRFRGYFGAWMTKADHNRVDFILHQIHTVLDDKGAGEDCGVHGVRGSITDIYEQDFIVDDDDDFEKVRDQF